jgi:hypothetical protein
MKEVVTVCLAIDAETGAIIADAPFMVQASGADRSGVYASPRSSPNSLPAKSTRDSRHSGLMRAGSSASALQMPDQSRRCAIRSRSFGETSTLAWSPSQPSGHRAQCRRTVHHADALLPWPRCRGWPTAGSAVLWPLLLWMCCGYPYHRTGGLAAPCFATHSG